MGLKWSQNDPVMVPKMVQNGPKMVHKWSKIVPNGPKIVPKWSQNRQALFVVSVLTAKPVFVVSVLTAKPVFVVSVGLRVFQKI